MGDACQTAGQRPRQLIQAALLPPRRKGREAKRRRGDVEEKAKEERGEAEAAVSL